MLSMKGAVPSPGNFGYEDVSTRTRMASPRYGREGPATRVGAQDERADSPPRRSSGRERLLDALPIAVGIGFWTFFIARNAFRVDGHVAFSLFDDAMISMRYARNLAEGYGLTWNPGETPVEGYTNPLWTLWMALLHLLPVSPLKISLAVMLSGVALLIANVIAVGKIARRLWPDRGEVARAAMWLTAANYGLAYWTLRGMEVGLVAFCLTAAAWLCLRLRDHSGSTTVWLLAFVFAAAVLTRWDTFAGLVPIGFYALRTTSGRKRASLVLIVGGALALTLAAQILFRLATYGTLVPNTYVLKVESVEPSARLARGLLADVHSTATFLPLIIGLAGLGLSAARARDASVGWLLAGPFLGVLAYSALIGGDAWEFMSHPNRFVCASLPLLAVLAASGLDALVCGGDELAPRRARMLAMVCAVAAWIALVTVLEGSAALQLDVKPPHLALRMAMAGSTMIGLLGFARWQERSSAPTVSRAAMLLGGALFVIASSQGEAYGRWWVHNASHAERDQAMARLGLAVQQATSANASIAVTWAGALSYFSQRRAFDLLGKTDHRVARTATPVADVQFWPGHDKRDFDYSIGELRPDVILGVWRLKGEDEHRIASWGYAPLGNGVFVLRASPRVERDKLAAAVGLMDVMRKDALNAPAAPSAAR